MISLTMNFYLYRDQAGNIHIQNAVGGMFGQHHVHTPEDFNHWRKDTDHIIELQNGYLCDCGMQPGQVVQADPHSGKIDSRFAKQLGT